MRRIYPRLQFVVQDACSPDGTEEILKSFLGRGVDISIEPDHGQADALNRGFARTSADVMGYLNSDDFYFLAPCTSWGAIFGITRR